jgi:DNA-binding MarR family transcriptional regulator
VRATTSSDETVATSVEADTGDISALMFASRAVLAAAVRALESVDATVSVPQMRVLVLLWTGAPLNLSAVAEGLGVNASNASRTCDRLVAAGLVDRGERAVDRRHVALTLTTRGRTLVERLMTRREQELATIVARMSEVDRRHLMTALAPFNQAASSDLWPSRGPSVARDPRLLEWGI